MLPFQLRSPARCSLLEGEPGRNLNDAAGDRCGGDLPHAWIGNPRCKRAWIEVVAGISETWMVQDVDSVHPQLQIALFPPRQTPSLGQ